MRANIARTLCFVALVAAVAVAASAQGGPGCSNARVAGDWGYTKTGTLFLPTGPVPFATVGMLTLEANGTMSGINNGSVGGTIARDLLSGTFAVNPDCTGTTTVGVYSEAGALLRTIEMALVYDDDARQMRGLVTRLELPNGMILKSVITAEAKRVFGDRSDQQ